MKIDNTGELACLKITPPTFDEKTYQKQFEVVPNLNGWSEENNATALIASLKGKALSILQTMPVCQ